MELLPIRQTVEENEVFAMHPDCQDNLLSTLNYFNKIGYHPPWIGYYAQKDGELVGCAAYKGPPAAGKVEIAYGTFERFRQQGVGTEIAKKLVEPAQATDSSVQITACTLPENNFSTKILQKNGFRYLGTVYDEEDRKVWGWTYEPASPTLSD
ncbi:GNAT family N-acetyltransferase [Salmonirosea aquatica]|uniref:GNAT family N-acetyltransferase n=1 Tax=Salmonirosea aquatica TaxID=2654236 RepID=A0A7C9BFG0_9BACT|nr:GNAT family N-acetyltransferase [Cytophagaceae bacterium SJW1-29]